MLCVFSELQILYTMKDHQFKEDPKTKCAEASNNLAAGPLPLGQVSRGSATGEETLH